MPATPAFPGFPLGLLHFLEELSRSNNKKWFDANKQRYEQEVREPALAFIAAMAGPSGKNGPLAKVSPHFLAVPKKVGGSLMRVHRDIRFSKDKTPYKTNVGIQFRHETGRDVHAPGFYFHIDTEQVFLGAGIWRPDSAALGSIRSAIDADPKAWKRAKSGKAFGDHFELSGESLKRPPRGYEADHPMIEDLKRKDHIAVCNLDHDALFEPDVVKTVADRFKATKAYVGFLCGAVGINF
ncbi:MAG: DUF2461 domain-containing protein [Planctomycetota bacterium]